MTAAETVPPPKHNTKIRASRIAGHAKGCLCDGCAKTATRYKKRRLYQLHRNTWTPLTDAAPTIELLREFLDAGWTERQIEYTAGLTKNYLRRILGYDDTDPAPAQLRNATVAAIQAIKRADRLNPAVPDDAYVNITGSVRRIQALAVGGWSQRMLAKQRGIDPTKLAEHELIRANRARAITAAYDELWNVPGPSGSAATRALKKGWASAMAWEGLDIDDPRTKPVGHRRGKLRRAEDLYEDSEELLKLGVPFDVIAERHDITVEGLERARERVKARRRAAEAERTHADAPDCEPAFPVRRGLGIPETVTLNADTRNLL